MAAGPGAEFMDVVLRLPAEDAHPLADPPERQVLALGEGAVED